MTGALIKRSVDTETHTGEGHVESRRGLGKVLSWHCQREHGQQLYPGLVTSRDNKVQFFKPLSFWFLLFVVVTAAPVNEYRSLRETAHICTGCLLCKFIVRSRKMNSLNNVKSLSNKSSQIKYSIFRLWIFNLSLKHLVGFIA